MPVKPTSEHTYISLYMPLNRTEKNRALVDNAHRIMSDISINVCGVILRMRNSPHRDRSLNS